MNNIHAFTMTAWLILHKINKAVYYKDEVAITWIGNHSWINQCLHTQGVVSRTLLHRRILNRGPSHQSSVIHNSKSREICFLVIPFLGTRWLQIYGHAMTPKLSWYRHTFVAIISLAYRLEQNKEIPSTLNYHKKTLVWPKVKTWHF